MYVYVCFVFALVRKNGIVRAPEVKPLINQSINHGNHKLIRWRFVIHAAIDGYSRLVTYIQCSDNNRADTVIQYFLRATREYGIPSRVRTDLGGENARIWERYEVVTEDHTLLEVAFTTLTLPLKFFRLILLFLERIEQMVEVVYLSLSKMTYL